MHLTKTKKTNQISSQQVGDSVIWENQHTVTHVIVGVGGNEQEADPNLDFSVVPDPNYGRTYNPSRAQSEVKLLSFTLILSRSLSLSFYYYSSSLLFSSLFFVVCLIIVHFVH